MENEADLISNYHNAKKPLVNIVKAISEDVRLEFLYDKASDVLLAIEHLDIVIKENSKN